jgi:hypothetical protein
MIEIFQGRIGGGKTYNAVLRIASHAAKGGHVFTNIELHPQGFVKLCEAKFRQTINFDEQIHYLGIDQISCFNKHIASGSPDVPVLVVIDEAHLWFNARQWSKADPNFLTFLTQSRKVQVDVIFITQSMATIDKQLRIQAQFVWAFKDFRRFLSWFPFPLIMCLRFDVDASTLIDYHWVYKRKIVFDAYNTNALLRPIDWSEQRLTKVLLSGVRRKKSKSHFPFRFRRYLLKHPAIILTIALAAIIVIIYRVIDIILYLYA